MSVNCLRFNANRCGMSCDYAEIKKIITPCEREGTNIECMFTCVKIISKAHTTIMKKESGGKI